MISLRAAWENLLERLKLFKVNIGKNSSAALDK